MKIVRSQSPLMDRSRCYHHLRFLLLWMWNIARTGVFDKQLNKRVLVSVFKDAVGRALILSKEVNGSRCCNGFSGLAVILSAMIFQSHLTFF